MLFWVTLTHTIIREIHIKVSHFDINDIRKLYSRHLL